MSLCEIGANNSESDESNQIEFYCHMHKPRYNENPADSSHRHTNSDNTQTYKLFINYIKRLQREVISAKLYNKEKKSMVSAGGVNLKMMFYFS